MELLFFTNNLEKLRTGEFKDITLVLGNESCDLDSAVSSIAYAAFLYWQYSIIKSRVCTRANRDKTYTDNTFVPILNVKRRDFAIKTEIVHCLRQCKVNETSLDSLMVFRDDMDLEELVNTKKVEVVVVDHHVLSAHDQFLAPYVTEIIDHRPLDQSKKWEYNKDTRSTIDQVGSCCTLVAQRIKEQSALLVNETEFFKTYPICTRLLYYTIILDTMNFSKVINKGTPQDEDVVLFLERVRKIEDYETSRKEILENLLQARSAVTHLSALQILKKDAKIVSDIYLASFPLLVSDLFEKPDAPQCLSTILQDSNCNVLLLLGMKQSGAVGRDLGIYCSDRSKLDEISKLLISWSNPSLDLVAQSLASAPNVAYFKQNNVSASRKQYIAAVNDYLKK